jgi:hypothetical protein
MTLLNLFEEIFEKITIVIITCVCGYLLIKYNQLSIGYFLFVININILLNENIRKLPLFFLKYAEYKKMSRMFINFVHIGNIKNDGKVELKNIDKITFKNKLNNEIIINNGDLLNENIVGYEKLVETLSNFNHDSKSILINNICTNNYNIITVLDSLIVVNATTKMNKNILLEHLDESFLIEAIKKFNLNLTSKNINISEQQIINLLICCCCKNKIIILNDCMRYINDTNIEYINNEIISTITKNNFLIKYF